MHKGFKCRDPIEGRVYIYWDIFYEHVFPFSTLHRKAWAWLKLELAILPKSLIKMLVLAMLCCVINICLHLYLLILCKVGFIIQKTVGENLDGSDVVSTPKPQYLMPTQDNNTGTRREVDTLVPDLPRTGKSTATQLQAAPHSDVPVGDTRSSTPTPAAISTY